MVDVLRLKREVCAVIDARQEEIIALGTYLLHHPELGYKEVEASRAVAEMMREMGLKPVEQLALTGVRAVMPGGSHKVKLALMGELDALVCPGHPFAHALTGAAHACGHHAQVAGMMGAALGLHYSGSMEHLAGDVVLFAVPAEEYVELEYRQKLRLEGKISFLGGKQELLAIGALDDIDMCLMFHQSSELTPRITIGGTSNGFIGKMAKFTGREAHAGGSPHTGVNALNAAMLAMMAIHAQRETFRDDDHIRVHPIITKGGDLVNVIPADVRMETYVRGATMEAILDASRKVDRALHGGAIAVGAEVDIVQLPGYLPRRNESVMSEVFRQNAAALVGEHLLYEGRHGAGSSDIGDISHIMPTLHPYIGGAKGRAHASDFVMPDTEWAYIIPAKIMAMTVVDLLSHGAAKALEAKAKFRPAYTRESYRSMWQNLLS